MSNDVNLSWLENAQLPVKEGPHSQLVELTTLHRSKRDIPVLHLLNTFGKQTLKLQLVNDEGSTVATLQLSKKEAHLLSNHLGAWARRESLRVETASSKLRVPYLHVSTALRTLVDAFLTEDPDMLYVHTHTARNMLDKACSSLSAVHSPLAEDIADIKQFFVRHLSELAASSLPVADSAQAVLMLLRATPHNPVWDQFLVHFKPVLSLGECSVESFEDAVYDRLLVALAQSEPAIGTALFHSTDMSDKDRAAMLGFHYALRAACAQVSKKYMARELMDFKAQRA